MAPEIRIITVRPDPEGHRRWNLRSNYLVPIYVMWTSDVPQGEALAGLQGVYDTVQASGQRRDVVVLGLQRFGTGDYSSPDWYIEQAYCVNQRLRRDAGFGPQIDVSQVMQLFYKEPWQVNPHWEVFIVNHDLNDTDRNGNYLNFVFGSTNPEFAASVQSITRLMASVPNEPLRLAMIRRLLRHEVGHMFGLPNRRYNVEQSLGAHCASNVCTMRQGLSIEEWATLTQAEERNRVHFCNDCTADLGRVRDRFRPLPQ